MSSRDHAAMAAARRRAHLPLSRGRRPGSGAGDAPRRVAGAPGAGAAEFADAACDGAAAVIAEALGGAGEWLGLEDDRRAAGLLRGRDARVAARRRPGRGRPRRGGAGGPRGAQGAGPAIVHKTDLGAVRVGLEGAAEVAGAAVQMDEALAAPGSSARASSSRHGRGRGRAAGRRGQRPGLRAGARLRRRRDAGRAAARTSPCGSARSTADDAGEMIRSLAIYPAADRLPRSARRRPRRARGAVLRVGAMVDAHREIAELDLNPVMAGPDGALVGRCADPGRAGRRPVPGPAPGGRSDQTEMSRRSKSRPRARRAATAAAVTPTKASGSMPSSIALP